MVGRKGPQAAAPHAPKKPRPWKLEELVEAGWSSRSIAAVLNIQLAKARAARG